MLHLRHIDNGERLKIPVLSQLGFKIQVQAALSQWLPKAGMRLVCCCSLRDKAQQWWYFLNHPEVPPDNNRSERSLRLAVTKRKVCGSRSMEGFAQTAILLTVIQTCRVQLLLNSSNRL